MSYQLLQLDFEPTEQSAYKRPVRMTIMQNLKQRTRGIGISFDRKMLLKQAFADIRKINYPLLTAVLT
jgi:hypothetical protein